MRRTYPSGSTDELELKEKKPIEELSGKLARDNDEQKLMHSVLENDSDTIDDGKLIAESFNQGISSFTPDIVFQNMVQNYANAEKIYGEKLVRLLTGYDPNYLRKNVRIPEFQRELKIAIQTNIKNLKRNDLLDNEGMVTSKGIYLASLVLYTEELDELVSKGYIGSKENKKKSYYGDKEDVRGYARHDRYRDIELKKTIKKSIKRGHELIFPEDLTVAERKSKGTIELIYALDASGSMRGKKIETAKKAGIALAFKAVENRDKVGLIVFGSDIKEEIPPTDNFMFLLQRMAEVKASKETNFPVTIEKAVSLFSMQKCTKHLIMLTDALPTIGTNPEVDTLKAVSHATAAGITISLVGIGLDEEGESLAKKIMQVSNGKLYAVKNLDDVDKIMLEDYDRLSD
jgi:Mg-chelatase subunit ChlD